MTLVLAGAPIGRVEDASPRLAAELAAADLVAAEDTRRLRRLAADLGVELPGRVVSYFEANERERTPALLDALLGGERVVLVTDAGMPTVSDPGYRLVAAAAAAGVHVTVVPGPSAALAALAVSGLPTDRFCFEGFLPRRTAERARRLAELATEPRTLVFFESPRRTHQTLAAMAEVFGVDRPAALCRELTKTYEEVRRGRLADLAAQTSADLKGEVTLVVGGASASAAEVSAAANPEHLRALVEEAVAGGLSRRDAVAAVAARVGVPRRTVYAAGHGTS